MFKEDKEEEADALSLLCETIYELLEQEITQQLTGDTTRFHLTQLDMLLLEYQTCESLLLTTGALRYSSSARNSLKYWRPLLDVALKKWPEDKKVFVGLI